MRAPELKGGGAKTQRAQFKNSITNLVGIAGVRTSLKMTQCDFAKPSAGAALALKFCLQARWGANNVH